MKRGRTYLTSKRLASSLVGYSTALLGLLMVYSGSVAHAAPRPMRFERLTLDDGLSQNTVLTLEQDAEGFMWFGTEDGLNRFDGRSFTQHRHQRDQAEGHLAGSYIRSIAKDSLGHLWIATDGGGVAQWDAEHSRFSVLRHDPSDAGTLASDGARVVFVDDNDVVWVGTRDSGLDRIDPVTKRVKHFRHDASDPTSLSNDSVLAITADRGGMLWIGTEKGINRFDRATGEFVRFGEAPVRSILEDRTGTLWVGTKRGGLMRLDAQGNQVEVFRHDATDPTSLGNDTVRQVLEDRDGRLWVGTRRGLDLLDRSNGTFSHYRHDSSDAYSLSSDDVMALYEDRGGLLWVATKSGGLNRWNPRTWSFGHTGADPDAENALSSPLVTSFSQDAAGRLWVGTMGGGLNRFNPVTGEWKRYRAESSNPRGLASDHVMTMIHDHQGTLWVGTMNAGLGRFDSSTGNFEFFRNDPQDSRSLSADAVMRLFEDDQGVIWAGTFRGGISRFDRRTGTFERFAFDPESLDALGSPIVTAFAQDLTGSIWVGTDGGGLHLYNATSGTFRRYQNDPTDITSLSGNTIYSLHIDAAGDLWIGTRGGGLNKMIGSPRAPEKVSFQSYSSSDGLGNSDVYGIESDARGDIWLSTNAGLSRLDPKTGEVKNFRRSHGLQDSEFNYGAHFRSASGELFFGGINGFNSFNPVNLEQNPIGPKVALTSVAVNNAMVTTMATAEPAPMRLGHRDDMVMFEFAALDYADPEANRYSYMLEGFDEDWVQLDGVGRVSYTNLAPGRYTFRVKAANSDGVWNEEGMNMSLSVAPAPWHTWWAYTLYGLAIAGSLLGFVRIQQSKVEREEEYSRELEDEVRHRTGELEERNSQLESLNSRLMEASLTDSLTGLRNRRYLFEEVIKDISMVRRRNYEVAGGLKDPEVFDLVFLMVDLDHFKSINDGCGHLAGDQVLVDVRSILLETCRASDVVIRWGGDEFLIVARDTVSEQAALLAERIRASIGKYAFQLGNGQVARMTTSIGFACFPFIRAFPDAVSWEQVLQFADSAMYEAKKGRDGWVGFMGTEGTMSHEGSLKMIRESPEELIEQGAIEVVRSKPNTTPIPGIEGDKENPAVTA